jgi:hypothetical protein
MLLCGPACGPSALASRGAGRRSPLRSGGGLCRQHLSLKGAAQQRAATGRRSRVLAAAEGGHAAAEEGALTPDSVVKDEFFEVEKLLGVRASLEGEDPVVEYRVKWKDGRPDTWCGAALRRRRSRTAPRRPRRHPARWGPCTLPMGRRPRPAARRAPRAGPRRGRRHATRCARAPARAAFVHLPLTPPPPLPKLSKPQGARLQHLARPGARVRRPLVGVGAQGRRGRDEGDAQVQPRPAAAGGRRQRPQVGEC